MKHPLLLLALLSAAPALAKAPRRYPYASAKCRFQGKNFTAKLDSIFKAHSSDDESEGAQFLTIGGKGADARSGKNVRDQALNFVQPSDDSLCDETQAYAMSGNVVAVLYRSDNRPFQDILRAAFYDPAKREVVKVEKNLGALDDTVATSDGFAFSSVLVRSDADMIRKKSPWGKDLVGNDEDLGALRRVTFEDGNVKIAYDPALSFQRSKWKDFYKTKEDYLKDAGWDPQAQTFANVVVYAPSYFNRNESNEEQKCIAMTTKRGAKIPEDHWRCAKIAH